MVGMRLLDEAFHEIKKLDPETAVTKNFIRQLALENRIPCTMAGRKRLINFRCAFGIHRKPTAGAEGTIQRDPSSAGKTHKGRIRSL